MTKREIVFMACRLMALYLILNSFIALSNTVSAFQFLTSISSTSGAAGTTVNFTFNNRPATFLDIFWAVLFRILPPVLNWLGAVFLWMFAREIANRLFENGPKREEGEPAFQIGTEVREVAFACLGVFFLAQDLPNAIMWGLNAVWGFIFWSSPSPFGNYAFSYRPALESLIRIPISLWFVFGLRGLAGLWRAAQEKGMAPVDVNPRAD